MSSRILEYLRPGNSIFSWPAFFITLVALTSSNEAAVPNAAMHCYEAPLSPACTGRLLSLAVSAAGVGSLGGFVVGFGGVRAKALGVIEAGIGLEPKAELTEETSLLDGLVLLIPVLWLGSALAAIIAGKFKVKEPTSITKSCVALMDKVRGGGKGQMREEGAPSPFVKGGKGGKKSQTTGTGAARKRK